MSIVDRKWDTVSTDCCICNANNTSELWIKNSFHYVKCNICGLIYVNPRLTMDEVLTIYKYGFQSKLNKKEKESDQSKYYKLIKTFKIFRKNNRILDIGCFNGVFLKGAKELGWDIYGSEISSEAAEFAFQKTNGGDIRVGTLENISFENDFFDVVVLLDVIEHLPNPFKTLNEINRILRPGGLLYFDTPNFNSLERYIQNKSLHIIFPWHFYYFTKDTVRKLLYKTDFKDISCYSVGFGSFSTFNPMKGLQEKGNIAGANSMIRQKLSKIKKFRYIVIVYRTLKDFVYLFFRLLSKVGVNIGSHLIVSAIKPTK